MPFIRIVTFASVWVLLALAQPLSAQDTAKQDPKKTLKMPSVKKTPDKKGMVGLNPQPEPPSQARKGKLIKPGEMRGLNPQPEPPSAPAK
jgi:hypothetical protein